MQKPKGWRERRVYVRSLGRAVAPEHRRAAMRRGTHQRKQWTKQRHYNSIFGNKPPANEQMYDIDIESYMWEKYRVPPEITANTHIPQYRGTLGKLYYWKREVDRFGRNWKRQIEQHYARLDQIEGAALSDSAQDAIMQASMNDEGQRTSNPRGTPQTIFNKNAFWRNKQKEPKVEAPYTTKERREESAELKKERARGRPRTVTKTKAVKKRRKGSSKEIGRGVVLEMPDVTSGQSFGRIRRRRVKK